MILVLGGGFGLYGHLAALAGMNADVAAPARYRQLLMERPELVKLEPRIHWVSEPAAMEVAEQVVLARRPQDNAATARAMAKKGYAVSLVIEKPIAQTHEQARSLSDELDNAGIGFDVPYLFLHCPWTHQVRDALACAPARVRIDWAFRAAAPGLDWKRTLEQGGGNLAYYFIHCIALAEGVLPDANYTWHYKVSEWGTEAISLLAERHGAELIINFDQTRGETHFRATIDELVILAEPTPFGPVPRRGSSDPRVPILQRFYRDEVFGTSRGIGFHHAIERRWSALAHHIEFA